MKSQRIIQRCALFGLTCFLQLPCFRHEQALAADSGLAKNSTSQNGLAAADQELDVEVLSLTVSKLKRDTFGNGINPFISWGVNQSEAGTVLLARVSPKVSKNQTLRESDCNLVSFRDDVGTDLSPDPKASASDSIFEANRSFQILHGRDSPDFGVRVRSTKVPATNATHVRAEIALVYARQGDEQLAQNQNVAVQTNSPVQIGPLRLRFIFCANRSQSGTNQVEKTCWLVSFRPDKDVVVSSVAVFAAERDEPILYFRDLESRPAQATHSRTTQYSSTNGVQSSNEEFHQESVDAETGGYVFEPPSNMELTVKVRYFKPGDLIEKRATLSAGIGL